MNYTNNANYILESNLICALRCAVDALKERESRISPAFCSCQRAALQENLSRLEQGHGIEVRR